MKVGIDTLLTEHSIDVAVLAKRAEEIGFEIPAPGRRVNTASGREVACAADMFARPSSKGPRRN